MGSGLLSGFSVLLRHKKASRRSVSQTGINSSEVNDPLPFCTEERRRLYRQGSGTGTGTLSLPSQGARERTEET